MTSRDVHVRVYTAGRAALQHTCSLSNCEFFLKIRNIISLYHSCQVLKDGNRDSKFLRADITSHAPSRDHAR